MTGAVQQHPKNERDWRQTHPYSIDFNEDSSKPETHDMRVRLDGGKSDLIKSRGDWDEDCVDMENGQDVVFSNSGGSVKDSGATGSGAWLVKGRSLSYSHREYHRTPQSNQSPTDLITRYVIPKTHF